MPELEESVAKEQVYHSLCFIPGCQYLVSRFFGGRLAPRAGRKIKSELISAIRTALWLLAADTG